MQIKKSTLWMCFVIVVLIIGGFVFVSSGSKQNNNINNAGAATVSDGGVQKVVISIKNYNYYPNTIRVKVGQPVSISLDSSVQGCYRSFTIRQLGLQKYLATPSDTLTFTPTEKGTYRFACAMGMGVGTLIVE